MLLEALHVTALVRSLLFSSHYLKGLLINIHKPTIEFHRISYMIFMLFMLFMEGGFPWVPHYAGGSQSFPARARYVLLCPTALSKHFEVPRVPERFSFLLIFSRKLTIYVCIHTYDIYIYMLCIYIYIYI